MQPIYMLQAVDIRRADADGTTRRTTISKLTIPKIEFANASHNPGGGVMAVDFTLPRIQALEPAFSIKGLDTEVFSQMGTKHRWTLACAYRDKTNGKDIAARGTIEGVVQAWEPDESDPEEFQGCNHIFKEVTFFELSFDEKELFHVDFNNNEIRLNGESLTEGVNSALGA